MRQGTGPRRPGIDVEYAWDATSNTSTTLELPAHSMSARTRRRSRRRRHFFPVTILPCSSVSYDRQRLTTQEQSMRCCPREANGNVLQPPLQKHCFDTTALCRNTKCKHLQHSRSDEELSSTRHPTPSTKHGRVGQDLSRREVPHSPMRRVPGTLPCCRTNAACTRDVLKSSSRGPTYTRVPKAANGVGTSFWRFSSPPRHRTRKGIKRRLNRDGSRSVL